MAEDSRPPADIFETSFEGDQGYTTGWVQDQNGWGIDRTVQNPNEVDVIVSGVMDMPVPVGAQMLKSAAYPASANLTYTKEPTEGFFTFSALFAYEPLDPEKMTSKFYLGHEEGKFSGPCFGITRRDGAPVFIYRDGDEEHVLAPGQAPEQGVFYRFECDVDAAAKTYTVRVYLHEGNSLIGEAQARVRDDIRRYNNLLMVMAPTAYVDDIWIGSKPR